MAAPQTQEALEKETLSTCTAQIKVINDKRLEQRNLFWGMHTKVIYTDIL
jgi:hypothetical protein